MPKTTNQPDRDPKLAIANDNSPLSVANDNNALSVTDDYFEELYVTQHAPALLLKFEKLRAAIPTSRAICVPNAWLPNQLPFQGFYLGFTTPANENEDVHFHHEKHELYLLQAGAVESG